MIDVYTWPTPNGHKVHIMLHETGLEHVIHPVNIQAGEQFDEAFLRISPNNKMPAIVDRDGPDGNPLALFESGAILLYLGNKTGRYLPTDPHAYNDVVQWLMFQMASVGPMLGQAHHFHAYAPERVDREKLQYGIDRYVNESIRIYKVLERRLEGREWIAADQYTIADMAIMPWLRNPAKQGVDIVEFPNVARWRDKIGARPQVRGALETLAENRRTSNAMSDEAWEMMYGRTQTRQGVG